MRMCVCVYTEQWQASKIEIRRVLLIRKTNLFSLTLIIPAYLCDRLSLQQKHTEQNMHLRIRAGARSGAAVCVLFAHHIQKHSFIVNTSCERRTWDACRRLPGWLWAFSLFESNFKGCDKSRWSAFGGCVGCRGNGGSNLIQYNRFEYYGEAPEIGWLQFGDLKSLRVPRGIVCFGDKSVWLNKVVLCSLQLTVDALVQSKFPLGDRPISKSIEQLINESVRQIYVWTVRYYSKVQKLLSL